MVFHLFEYVFLLFRRGAGPMGLSSSSRLSSSTKRGSIQTSGNASGDDSTTQDEAMDGDDVPI